MRTAEETRAQLTEISAAVARLVSEQWGRGPRRTRVSWAGTDTLLVLLEDGHTPAEQTLIARGHAAEVARMRALMHEALAPELTRIVEGVTGRVVRAALHATNEAPGLAAEVFVLAGPRPDAGVPSTRPVADVRKESAALRAESRQARARQRELREQRPT